MLDLKVLYAEDNEQTRQSYIDILKYYFKHVFESTDGENALKLYHEHNPDIIFTDINMPVLDGFEMVRRIREVDKTTKIIVLSAYSDNEKLMKAIPLGLSAYLTKPVKTDEFKNVMADILSSFKENNLTKISNEYYLNIQGRILYHKDKQIKLTSNEFIVLRMLSERISNVVSSENIAFALWNDYDEKSSSKIHNILKRLRIKIPNIIESVYGVGYKIKD